MEKYLKQGIKTVIEQFPIVGEILASYQIGCVDCGAGNCLLGDVVGIHNLSEDLEAELMARIEKAIYPQRDVQPRKVVRRAQTQIKYSPPVAEMVWEHTLIKRWLALVPQLIENLANPQLPVWEWVAKGAEFSRNFADGYHHAKEEDLLFKFVDESQEIIRTMYVDHDRGRAHVRGVLEAVQERNAQKVAEHLSAYRALLIEHIKKEDEILYPWIERAMTDTQIGQLHSQCLEVNHRLSYGNAKEYEAFITSVEKALK